MAEEKKNQPSPIFRQASLDRVSSPEGTRDYLRLPSAGYWMILAAAALLALGAAVWFGVGR